jgi:hypothetical protein
MKDRIRRLIQSLDTVKLLGLAIDILFVLITAFIKSQILKIDWLQKVPESSLSLLSIFVDVSMVACLWRRTYQEIIVSIHKLLTLITGLFIQTLDITKVNFTNLERTERTSKLQVNVSNTFIFDDFVFSVMDEEGRSYLIDLKSEWKKEGLTTNQINKKEFVFFVDHYWGRFVSEMRLPRFLSLIKIR